MTDLQAIVASIVLVALFGVVVISILGLTKNQDGSNFF